MYKDLVRLTTADVGKGIPITDSKIISEKLGLQHHTITRIIRKYKSDFEEFGNLGFEIQGKEKIYLINEMQFTLLVTYIRNNSIVTEYKKKFVKAFFLMKNELQARKETRHISIEIRKSLTDTIKNKVDDNTNFKHWAYSNYSKLIYKKLFGKTVKKLKEERHVPKDGNLRDFLSIEELKILQETESKVATYIEMRKEITDDKAIYEEVKKII